MAKAYTVSQVNTYIKNMFEQDYLLGDVTVKGEVSNCKYHSSGHIYFTLKDNDATIAVIMFKGNTYTGLKFKMSDGQKVVVNGSVRVYERDGRYQLYAKNITEEGEGDLYKKFLELKNELEEMGMFAPEYKKPIPKYAKTVGIVTAGTGAAIRDIINVATRRNPYIQLILYPALVQGKDAKYSIVEGIRTLDELKPDTIIIGRGGGSIEDLWAFNEEMVARAIFECETPIISAVGHETDFTIADFVSDLRAPTPSAAAELAVCDIAVVEEMLSSYENTLRRAVCNIIREKRDTISMYDTRLKYLNPAKRIEDNKAVLANVEERLQQAFRNILISKRNTLAIMSERLNGHSPLLKLKQGYSMVANSKDAVVTSVKQVKKDEVISIDVSDGTIEAQVCKTYSHKNER